MCRVINTTFSDITLPAKFTLTGAQTIPESGISDVWETDADNVSSIEPISDISFDIDIPDITKSDRAALIKFLEENRHVFAKDKSEDLGFFPIITQTIDTQGSRPVAQRFYRTSPEKRSKIDRQIEENLALGLIEPSTSEWHSPVVLVKKADNSWRLCCDYRKLNQITRPQSLPLPRLEDVWDAVGENKAKVFSSLDRMDSNLQTAP